MQCVLLAQRSTPSTVLSISLRIATHALSLQFREYLEANGWDTTQMGILPEGNESAQWAESSRAGSLHDEKKEPIPA